jgi:hypothetical protein
MILILLSPLQSDHETISMARSGNWSDGAIWAQMLEAGESHRRKATIFNMLGPGSGLTDR